MTILIICSDSLAVCTKWCDVCLGGTGTGGEIFGSGTARLRQSVRLKTRSRLSMFGYNSQGVWLVGRAVVRVVGGLVGRQPPPARGGQARQIQLWRVSAAAGTQLSSNYKSETTAGAAVAAAPLHQSLQSLFNFFLKLF